LSGFLRFYPRNWNARKSESASIEKREASRHIYAATSHNTNYYRAGAGGGGGGGSRQDHDELYLCRVAFELAFRQRHPARQKAELMHNQWSGIETRRSCAINDDRDGVLADVDSSTDLVSHAVSPITARLSPLTHLSVARIKSDEKLLIARDQARLLVDNEELQNTSSSIVVSLSLSLSRFSG